MTKSEFEPIFKLLCASPERPLSKEQLTDKRELFWIKFNKLDKQIFFDACMSWIDRSKFMPTVSQIDEIIDNQDAARQPPVKPPQRFKSKLTMRQHFESANKDLEGKKRHHIEHLDLVVLYDKTWGSKKRKHTEVIKDSNIKKLNDCF